MAVVATALGVDEAEAMRFFRDRIEANKVVRAGCTTDGPSTPNCTPASPPTSPPRSYRY